MRITDTVSLFLATGLGLGYLSGPTGTYGSLFGLALFALAHQSGSPAALALLTVALTVLAVGVSDRAVLLLKHEDPRQVVCDEVCGQWISLLFVPITWPVLLAAFLLFRFFDIVKPFPARRLENLPGGWGVVADDVMAGIYANIVLQLLLYFRLFHLG